MKLILSRRILNHGLNPTTPTSILLVLLLLSGPGRAQNPGSPSDPYGNPNPSMGVIIIVLIASFFFIGIFSIYVRHCSSSSSSSATGVRRSLAGSVARSRRAQRGLDKAVIETFPTFDYAAIKELKIGKGALECAVCLTEFEDDDTLRLIPKCDHVFHPDCIDAWLVAHATCPVCRTNLVPDPVSGTCSPLPQNDTVAEAREVVVEERESMEEPLQGSRTMTRNISIGRPRWLGRMRFARSFSTGHVEVKQWENIDRFTLRLPVEVRKQLMNGKLERSTSLVVLPRETSTRRGYRTGFSGGVRSGSVRSGPDRWVFSLAPPFFSRAPSFKSPGVDGSLRGSIRAESTRLPV